MKRCIGVGLLFFSFPIVARADERANEPTTVVVLARPQQPLEPDRAHFRFGVALDGALGFESPYGEVAALAGLELRAGVQVNQWFAVYYQLRGLLGATVDCSTCTGPAGAIFNSAVAELALPHLEIAVGPSLDVGSSAYFGLDGRIAYVTGRHGPGRHSGFSIGLDVHPAFTEYGADLAVSLGVGWEAY